jgi:hypothetical protein
MRYNIQRQVMYQKNKYVVVYILAIFTLESVNEVGRKAARLLNGFCLKEKLLTCLSLLIYVSAISFSHLRAHN